MGFRGDYTIEREGVRAKHLKGALQKGQTFILKSWRGRRDGRGVQNTSKGCQGGGNQERGSRGVGGPKTLEKNKGVAGGGGGGARGGGGVIKSHFCKRAVPDFLHGFSYNDYF